MSSSDAVAGPASRPTWLSVATCFLVATIEGYDIQILSISAPRFAPELGFSSGALGWIFGAVSFGIMIGSSVGGRAGDVFGHKTVLAAAIALFGTFTLLTPLCRSFETFLAVRTLTGIGFGIALPNLVALAANVAASGKAFRTNAAIFWGVPLGAVIAAALFSRGMGWQVAFTGGGVAAFACIPLVLLAFNNAPPPARTPLARTSFIAELLSDTYRARSMIIWAIFALAYLVSYFAAIWLPMIVSVKGYPPETAASVMLSYGILGMIGIFATGWACDRFSFQLPIALCWIAIIPVLVSTAFAKDVVSLHVIGGLTGFFVSGGIFSLYSVAAAGYPKHLRGGGSGAALAWARLGAIIGPLAGGWLLGTDVPIFRIMSIFSLIAFTTALLVIVAGRIFDREADLAEAARS
ncbi:MFS transporter [Henriciella aquimarina]|uniref:MFS transporter n=1 Tax=Henriciella aquimarina TaxID=545261 RepID=UPI000A0343D6|nr:MFS transporter [Henriciella aquimarina]